ncbi:MAG: tetratricopeptide repeat protein [Dermatophilaceae bacterium]
MSEPDPTMKRIGQGIELSQGGEREDARQLFAEVWSDIDGENGDPFHRCALAHSMADVQDDVQEELIWDLRALAAADLVTDERAALAGVLSPVAAFYPSLHLNLGECYRKIGDLDQAREHLKRGQDAVGSLGDDGYGRLIKGGLERLGERLASV